MKFGKLTLIFFFLQFRSHFLVKLERTQTTGSFEKNLILENTTFEKLLKDLAILSKVFSFLNEAFPPGTLNYLPLSIISIQ